jgi:hypothetical protein
MSDDATKLPECVLSASGCSLDTVFRLKDELGELRDSLMKNA